MNYILIHDGPAPKHLKYCIEQIKKIDTEAKIYLGINSKININNINIFNLNDIASKRTNEILKLNIFSTEKNRLWSTSLLRLFYLSDVAKIAKVSEFVHFDNDVLIYKSFNDIKEEFDFKKFNITPLTNDCLIFGYSFIPNLKIYNEILNKIYNYLSEFNSDYLVNLKSKQLNEMKLLYIIYEQNKNLFNLLSVTPNLSKHLFDPASYGQYLTGTKDRFSRKFIDEDHIVGKKIKNGEILPYFYKKLPYLKNNKISYQIINLHIHSKKLKKYTL